MRHINCFHRAENRLTYYIDWQLICNFKHHTLYVCQSLTCTPVYALHIIACFSAGVTNLLYVFVYLYIRIHLLVSLSAVCVTLKTPESKQKNATNWDIAVSLLKITACSLKVAFFSVISWAQNQTKQGCSD